MVSRNLPSLLYGRLFTGAGQILDCLHSLDTKTEVNMLLIKLEMVHKFDRVCHFH